jgi:Xaa-Pro aminopeptidase
MSELPRLSSSDLAQGVRNRFFDAHPHIDALVTLEPSNVLYLTGVRSMVHDLNRYYRLAAVVRRERVHLVAGAADGPALLEIVGDPAAIFRYGSFYVEPSAASSLQRGPAPAASFEEAFATAAASLLKSSDTVGVDSSGFYWHELEHEALLKPWRRCAVSAQLQHARSIKSPEEIERLASAARLLERAIDRGFAQAREGANERDMAAAVAHEITAGGGIPRTLSVTSGPRTALVDTFPTPRILQRGDLLRFDLDCTVEGYWADIARTGTLGPASAEQRRRFDAISAGLAAELACVRPGMRVAELFERTVAAVRAAGLPSYSRHNVGHGIGVESNEFPRLTPDSEAVLQPGMVLCIETPYYAESWGGMMTENMVVVTDGGCRPLSTPEVVLRQV